MQYFRYNASWSVYVKCRRRIVSLLVVPLAVVGVVSFHVSLTHGIQYGELSAISSYTSRHSQHSRHVVTALSYVYVHQDCTNHSMTCTKADMSEHSQFKMLYTVT